MIGHPARAGGTAKRAGQAGQGWAVPELVKGDGEVGAGSRALRVATVITRLEGGAGVLALRGAQVLDPEVITPTIVTGNGRGPMTMTACGRSNADTREVVAMLGNAPLVARGGASGTAGVAEENA